MIHNIEFLLQLIGEKEVENRLLKMELERLKKELEKNDNV